MTHLWNKKAVCSEKKAAIWLTPGALLRIIKFSGYLTVNPLLCLTQKYASLKRINDIIQLIV
jgi:hypothetical protein